MFEAANFLACSNVEEPDRCVHRLFRGARLSTGRRFLPSRECHHGGRPGGGKQSFTVWGKGDGSIAFETASLLTSSHIEEATRSIASLVWGFANRQGPAVGR